MSRYSYAGNYRNPTEGFFVKHIVTDDNECFQIWIREDRQQDGSCEPDRKHKTAPDFEEYGDAVEYIQQLSEFFEEDYESYLEENHYELAQMERYEAFRNEY